MKFPALIQKKECWVPSLYGWFALLVLNIFLLFIFIMHVHDFLTVNHPVYGEILVVESWIPDSALEKVASEFRNNDYKYIVVTGNRYFSGMYLSKYKSGAHLKPSTLNRFGIEKKYIIPITIADAKRNRTYSSALAIKEWLTKSELSTHSIDVFSIGPHARTTRLLFQRAFGDEIAVGIIAADDISYDKNSWWKTSRGAQIVINEVIGYLYARLFSF